ncbi:HelD family protein, partial [Thermobifida halotolerans]|uniref:HelD family protein n=1 Tax=Thermobifida halotolerans TaxID=483545 RepID=UPI001F416B2F
PRRYGFSPTAELTAFEDEPLTREASGAGGGSLLAEEIERPRSGPMRDIVATIQPEQDDLVRAPLERSLCVQGAPGTGKTAVGLHRVAYLLYAERERLERRGGVAIVGPNRSFLSYIRNVLPALGEVDVRQTTVADLLGAVPVRRAEPSEAALVKGDARMAEVIRRDLWSRLREPVEPLLVRQGSRRWRLYPDEMAEIVAELRGRGVSYGAGRELLAHRLAHAVLVLMEGAGQVCDDRTHDRVRRDRAVRAAVQQMWPRVEPVRQVLELLTDPDRMAEAADGLLTPDEQAAVMLPGRPRGPGSARWSLSDLALIDETAGLVERPASLGHVVVDEAQDLTPMQCRAIGRRVAGGSVTVLGDLAQGTVPGAVEDWETLLTHLGTPDARLSELVRGYRVPAQIIDFAARLLPRTAPGLARPVAFRQAPGSLTLLPTERADLTGTVLRACRTELAREGSVGLIAADAAVADLHRAAVGDGLPAALLGETEEAMAAARLVCVPASLAKGLEFDAVVVVEPAAVVAAEPRGLHRLYVVLTRAVSRMTVVHAEPLPEPLTG